MSKLSDNELNSINGLSVHELIDIILICIEQTKGTLYFSDDYYKEKILKIISDGEL